MSTYDDASLVFYPSGYKTSVLFSEKPMDANGQLTFTRASNATRVAPNGLIEEVRTNFARQSQSFATASAWATTNGTLTNNAGTAPDGTNTASKLVATNTDPFAYQSITLTGPVVASCYFKGVGSSIGKTSELRIGAAATTFTLTANWQRVSVTSTVAGAANYGVEAPNLSVVVGDEVLLWGFQVEYGDIATQYIATTTSARSTFAGITVDGTSVPNVPRIDYTGGGCGKLLLEPQRTNVALWSEQFDNAGWTKTNATITANAAVSPDGYTNADRLIPSNAAQGILQQNHNITAGQTNTLSVFAKASGLNDNFVLNSRDNASASNFAQIAFNLSTGTIATAATASGSYSAASGTITSYGNGWYRLTLTHTSSISTTTRFRYFNETASGNGTNGYLVYGAQAELNASYATSYINTLSTSVTRVADSCSKTGISSLIGQTEGTFYAEWEVTQADGGVYEMSLSDGSASNAVRLRQNSSNTMQLVVASSGAIVASISSATTIVVGQRYKLAGAYKLNDFVFYLNGTQVGSDSSGAVPATLTSIGTSRGDGNFPFYGEINQALVFKTRLSNSTLARLTQL